MRRADGDTIIADMVSFQLTGDLDANPYVREGDVIVVGMSDRFEVLAVNTLAPYMLTALIERPRRLVYLSSSMHRGGTASLRRFNDAGHLAGL